MMPRKRTPRDEVRERRRALAERAAAGQLRLPEGFKDMRTAIGLTQAEFARMLRMTVRQWAEIERGDANPTMETLERIGRAYGFQVGFVRREADRAAEIHPSALRDARTSTTG